MGMHSYLTCDLIFSVSVYISTWYQVYKAYQHLLKATLWSSLETWCGDVSLCPRSSENPPSSCGNSYEETWPWTSAYSER